MAAPLSVSMKSSDITLAQSLLSMFTRDHYLARHSVPLLPQLLSGTIILMVPKHIHGLINTVSKPFISAYLCAPSGGGGGCALINPVSHAALCLCHEGLADLRLPAFIQETRGFQLSDWHSSCCCAMLFTHPVFGLTINRQMKFCAFGFWRVCLSVQAWHVNLCACVWVCVPKKGSYWGEECVPLLLWSLQQVSGVLFGINRVSSSLCGPV